MMEFNYLRATDAAHAARLAAQQPQAKYLGGGTNLVDLMREAIEAPPQLIAVSGLARAIVRPATAAC